MKNIARKLNVTGIAGLSIGTTRNSKGYLLKRYSVNTQNSDGKKICASFYFGKNTTQGTAYRNACKYLSQKTNLNVPTSTRLKQIYNVFDH